MAIIGGASAFVESTLAQIYKRKDGEIFKGGPAYYIERAMERQMAWHYLCDYADSDLRLWL